MVDLVVRTIGVESERAWEWWIDWGNKEDPFFRCNRCNPGGGPRFTRPIRILWVSG